MTSSVNEIGRQVQESSKIAGEAVKQAQQTDQPRDPAQPANLWHPADAHDEDVADVGDLLGIEQAGLGGLERELQPVGVGLALAPADGRTPVVDGTLRFVGRGGMTVWTSVRTARVSM